MKIIPLTVGGLIALWVIALIVRSLCRHGVRMEVEDSLENVYAEVKEADRLFNIEESPVVKDGTLSATLSTDRFRVGYIRSKDGGFVIEELSITPIPSAEVTSLKLGFRGQRVCAYALNSGRFREWDLERPYRLEAEEICGAIRDAVGHTELLT